MKSIDDREMVKVMGLLHSCLKRKMPLEIALQSVVQGNGTKIARKFSARILHGIKAGESLESSLRTSDPNLPPMVLGLVFVGERTGKLALCMGYLIDYYQRNLEVKRRLSRGFIYPVVVIGFIWISLGVFDQVICGVFESLYRNSEVNMPSSMSSTFFIIHWLFLAPMFLVPLLTLSWIIARRLGTRVPSLFDLAARLVPTLVRRSELDRLFYTLHIALSGGLELSSAFAMAYGNVKGQRLRKQLAVVHVAIERGATLTSSLERTHLLEAQDLSIIRLAEQSGDLQEAFGVIATGFRAQVEDQLQRVQSLLQPALVVFLGVVVLLLLVLLYRPLFMIGDLL